MKEHWARALLGKPWSRDGEGPDRFSCWGLVRTVFRERYGLDLPLVGAGDLASVSASQALKADASGWGSVPLDQAREGDLVMLDRLDGERHVGVIVQASSGLRVLHAEGYVQRGKEVGTVCIEPLEALVARGAIHVELWRRG